MDIVCQAATMKSVESVVVSLLSVLEHHSRKSRPLKAETIQGEMMVFVNGPLVSHSQVSGFGRGMCWSEFFLPIIDINTSKKFSILY